MPLTEDGKKVLNTMVRKHGGKKGTLAFYASINKGVPGSDKWHDSKKTDAKKNQYTKGLMG